MQAISEVMTHDLAVVSPDDTVRHAAELMRDWNIGALPVCEGQRLVGMLTDRDITIRGVAQGCSPDDVRVSEMMTKDVLWCFEDQTVGEVLQEMGDRQIRRIPVMNRDMQLVGIVALGDLAIRHYANLDDTLEEISMPSQPNRPSADEMRTRRPQSDSGGGIF